MVLAATVTAFLPVLGNDFVAFDDDAVLLENERFRGFSPAHLYWMLTSVTLGHWQPLTWLSYALDHRFWGMDPRGFHATSLALHAGSALALYMVLRRLLRLGVGGALVEPAAALSCGLAALAWSVHPLRVESVAWATERRDVLSGLFWLLAIAAYLRAVDPGPVGRSRPNGLVLAIACTALSLLAKSWGMTLFAVLLVLDVHPLRRWRAGARARVLVEKLPFAALGIATAVVVWRGVREYMPGVGTHGVGERVAQAAYGLCFYLWKTLAPRALVPMYEFREALDPLALPYLACVLAVVGFTALTWTLRRRWPSGLAAWVAYAVILSPVLGITQAGPQIAADRYAYLAMLPWSAVLAGTAYRLARASVSPAVRGLAATAAAGVLLGLGVATARQSRVWASTETLWSHAVSVAPDNAFARANLAGILLRTGRIDEAREQVAALAAQVAARPDDRGAAIQLGVAQGSLALLALREGRGDDAIALLEQAIVHNPQDARLRITIAAAYVDRGDVDRAMAAWEAALERSRVDAATRGAMGRKLLERERGVEAERVLRPALDLAPDDPVLRTNLGVALWQQQRRSDAIAQWRETLRRHPDDRDARELLERVQAAPAAP